MVFSQEFFLTSSIKKKTLVNSKISSNSEKDDTKKNFCFSPTLPKEPLGKRSIICFYWPDLFCLEIFFSMYLQHI